MAIRLKGRFSSSKSLYASDASPRRTGSRLAKDTPNFLCRALRYKASSDRAPRWNTARIWSVSTCGYFAINTAKIDSDALWSPIRCRTSTNRQNALKTILERASIFIRHIRYFKPFIARTNLRIVIKYDVNAFSSGIYKWWYIIHPIFELVSS
jgi:hypothetical protein